MQQLLLRGGGGDDDDDDIIIIVVMQHVSPKVWYLFTTVHGVTFQRKAVHICNIEM
jgi:hypothetical protein